MVFYLQCWATVTLDKNKESYKDVGKSSKNTVQIIKL